MDIPDLMQPDHYHAFDKVKHAPARVMVFIRRNVDKLKERFRVSEHPFGRIKFYDGAYYFLCKGKEKVAAETSLMLHRLRYRPGNFPGGRGAESDQPDDGCDNPSQTQWITM